MDLEDDDELNYNHDSKVKKGKFSFKRPLYFVLESENKNLVSPNREILKNRRLSFYTYKKTPELICQAQGVSAFTFFTPVPTAIHWSRVITHRGPQDILNHILLINPSCWGAWRQVTFY